MSGDSLDVLFRRCRPDLERFFRRRVGSAETVADLLQETFLRLLRAEPATGLRDPQAYLFRTAGNLVTDHYRAAAGRGETKVENAEWQALRDPHPSPESIVLSREELAVLARAIEELTPREREVFRLHKFEGLSYEEVAARLGIAKNTVMVHMVRALGRCKAQLDAYRRESDPSCAG